MILFEKKYQTFDTVFHHQMKHCISCLIYYMKTSLCLYEQRWPRTVQTIDHRTGEVERIW